MVNLGPQLAQNSSYIQPKFFQAKYLVVSVSLCEEKTVVSSQHPQKHLKI